MLWPSVGRLALCLSLAVVVIMRGVLVLRAVHRALLTLVLKRSALEDGIRQEEAVAAEVSTSTSKVVVDRCGCEDVGILFLFILPQFTPVHLYQIG